MAKHPKRITPLLPHFEGELARHDPHGLDRLNCTQEQVEWIQGQALSIFTECSNAGRSFREALAAVYLSGMNAAHQVHTSE
jgi:hypothetical protein